MKDIMTTRNMVAVFTGILVFFFLFAFVLWLVNFFGITPHGEFVSTFIKGRTPDEAKAFKEANQELFDEMLSKATRFDNLCILPSITLVMGLVVGFIADYKRGIVGIIAALPVSILFWVRSSDEPDRLFYVVMVMVVSSIGALAGGWIVTKISEKSREDRPDELT